MQCHQHYVSKYTVQYINILMMALKCIFLSFGRTVLERVFVISRKKNLISEWTERINTISILNVCFNVNRDRKPPVNNIIEDNIQENGCSWANRFWIESYSSLIQYTQLLVCILLVKCLLPDIQAGFWLCV